MASEGCHQFHEFVYRKEHNRCLQFVWLFSRVFCGRSNDFRIYYGLGLILEGAGSSSDAYIFLIYANIF